jgi:diguanylate cyclase
MIDLAHSLGLSVVAEGVEDQAAMDLLIEYGCDSAQGYLLGRPSEAGALTRWLTESAHRQRVALGP